MDLALTPPYPPMETEQVESIPSGERWQYEPKWDGFRCLAYRDGEEVFLQSRNEKPLSRYFPDVVEALRRLPARRFVLDGELVVPVDRRLSFEQLQLRLHPAASRVAKLVADYPAVLVVFDLLLTERNTLLVGKPLEERRQRLEAFADRYFGDNEGVRLSPARRDLKSAERWFRETSGSLDGVIAKRLDAPYDSGGRRAAVKVKNLRAADCVVAAFRYGRDKKRAASLLLGMYDRQDLLHHVGYTSSLSAKEFAELTPQLEAMKQKAGGAQRGFTGRSPGGPSRWSTERSREFESLPHQLVVEVRYDHVTGDRFRHGTRFLRWRPDKDPQRCQLDQIRTKGYTADLLEE